ncbi:lipoate--protein ligase [Clostridia bacterium]|nr:lipoate--protein ligase [Clostridia bacterium]
MLWRTEPTVMLGVNQAAHAEVNMDRSHELGVSLVRRPSGGGAIFTDIGTLQYTVITRYVNPDSLRGEKNTLVQPILSSLNKLGVRAELAGRNDILLDGVKISGVAQACAHGRLISHGSLLYSTDLDMLAQVLRPASDKFQSKAVKSVRSRVTRLCEILNMPFEEFQEYLKINLLTEQGLTEYRFTQDDLVQIELIRAAKFGNDEWTFTKSPEFTYHGGMRFAQGRIDAYVSVQSDVIQSLTIQGDFMNVSPIGDLTDKLIGVCYNRKTIGAELANIELEPYVGGITCDELISCIYE